MATPPAPQCSAGAFRIHLQDLLFSRPGKLDIETAKLLLDQEVLAYVYEDAISVRRHHWLDAYVEFRGLIPDIPELEPEGTTVGPNTGLLWNGALPGDPTYIQLTAQERRVLRSKRGRPRRTSTL